MLAAMDSPKHIIRATSVYDQDTFATSYTGLSAFPLYSFTGVYLQTDNPYKPTRDEILYISHMENGLADKLVAQVKKFKN